MKQRQYPAQTGIYAIKIKSEQSTHSWQDFDTTRIQISVGQDYHEGEKMLAVAEWAKPRFDKIQLCVNDTLQRFNLMFETGLDEVVARAHCASEGKQWVGRNFQGFFGARNVEVIHWDTWLNDPSYKQAFAQISDLYKDNEKFKQSIDGNIVAIWERRRVADALSYTLNRFKEFSDLSRRYLLEEIAVFSLMFERQTAIDVYPGSVIFAATVFQGQNVAGAPKGLGQGHFCRIDFSKRPEEKILRAA